MLWNRGWREALLLLLLGGVAGAEVALLNASAPCVFGMTAALSACKGANATAAGVRAAFAEVNEFSRLQLFLDLRDDAVNSTVATANVAAMLSDGVFGFVASSRFDPTAAFAAGVPVIAPKTGDAAFRAENATAVLARPSCVDIVSAALSLLAFDNHNFEALALVAEASPDGDEFVEVVLSELAAHGVSLVSVSRFFRATFDEDALAEEVSKAAPLAVLIAAGARATARFVAAYERLDTEKAPTVVALQVDCVQGMLQELVAHNVSSRVVVPMWLPDIDFTSSTLASSFRNAMETFEPQAELTFAALEGYLAGRIVSLLVTEAIIENRWPLKQSALLDAAFRLGTLRIGDWSVGPLSRSPSWCNQGEMHIRELELSAAEGIKTLFGSEWAFDTCGFRTETSHKGVVGQTVPTSGPMHVLGVSSRVGILLGLAHGSLQNLVLSTAYNNYNATLAAENAAELEHKVVAFVGCGGTAVAIAVLSVINESMPLIGTTSGAQSLRRPFQRNAINLRASYHDEATVLANFLVTKRNVSKFWVVFQDDAYGNDYFFGLQRALDDLGASIISNATFQNNNFDESLFDKMRGIPDALVFVGVLDDVEKALRNFIPRCPKVLVGINSAAVLSTIGPKFAASNISLDNVFTTSIVPPLSRSFKIVSEFLDLAIDEDSINEPTLEGFITGKFVAEIARLVLEDGLELTSQNMLDRVYSQKSFSISGLTFGPFSDACLTNGRGECCNQGLNRVWVAQYNAETQLLEEVPDFEFTLPQCGVDYTDEEGISTLGIVFAVVFPVVAVVAAIVITFALLDWRRRKQMAALKQRTVELEKRITELSIVDIGDLMHTPAEHAIALLNDLRQRKEPLTEQEKHKLKVLSVLIARNKLYDANFQVRSWKRKEAKHPSSGSSTPQPMDAEVEDYLRDTVIPVTAIIEKTPTPSRSSSVMEVSASVVVVMSEELRQAAESMKRWEFHPRMLGLDGSMKLSVVCTHLVDSCSLFSKLNLDKTKFAHWMQQIELGYKGNPYHSKEHAVDVLQAMHWMLVQGTELRAKISDIELLAALVAAACHDFGHGGVNNNFLLRTLDPLAIRYNGVSVLESMHAAESMRLLLLPENNFLESFDRQHFVEFHEIVVKLVLATDMAQHVKLLGEFNAALSTEKGLTLGSAAERLLVLQILIKMADLSNSSRPFEIYREWTDRVVQEFFAQGRQEKALGLQVSPFMDEEATNLAKMQTSFLGIVVRPVAEAVIKVVPAASVLLDNITANLKHWADKLPLSPPLARSCSPEIVDIVLVE